MVVACGKKRTRIVDSIQDTIFAGVHSQSPAEELDREARSPGMVK